jgi:hypothetical protein
VATSLTTFVRRAEYSGQEVKPGVLRVKQRPSSVIGSAVWAAERVASWLVHYPSWMHYVAIAAFVLPPWLDGASVFLALFLGVYAVYIAKTGLGVVLKLGSPRFYDVKPDAS